MTLWTPQKNQYKHRRRKVKTFGLVKKEEDEDFRSGQGGVRTFKLAN